ncbi:MAG: ABC transporter substrate-binding protein [Candidatus Methanoplasma sp.]|jgi:iron complex transport system substrate-binding protein|nr:ABC transporter substrate-binding protein [Candidatus Methanoplasma sp.]
MDSKWIIVIITAAIIVIAGAAVVVIGDDKNERGNGPVTVTDGLGNEVYIESSDKVSSTSATVTEIICGIGAYSKIAGVTVDDGPYKVNEKIIGLADDGYPGSILEGIKNNTITDMGGMWNIAAESILKSEPDLVIMGGYFNSPDTITALGNMDIPVVICKDDNSLDNIYFNIELIGKALGMESEAESLVKDMKSSIKKIVDWTDSLNDEPESVAVFMGYGSQYGTYANGQTYLMGSPMITMLGGTNAFSGIKGMYEIVSTESVITANPDIIIDSSPAGKTELESVTTSTLTSGISAVKNDRVYGTFDSCGSAFTLTSQGIVNSVAIMAMFMYEDHLNFDIDHFMGDDYTSYLESFWKMINA